MRVLRYELAGHCRRLKAQNLVTAARLKRMRSVRRKLRDTNIMLDKIQDLAGCRVIASSISEVNQISNAFREKTYHEFIRETNYIEKPKNGGYRSNHLIYAFNASKSEEHLPYHGRLVEIQIRTQLQHAWATAVEAVGMLRKEYLKGGQGSADWLRLFTLVSAEFAKIEGMPEVASDIADQLAIDEIRYLNERLLALKTLESVRNAIRYTERYVYEKTRYFLITHHDSGLVEVTGYSTPIRGTDSYDKAESPEVERTNSVLVEVDRVENLKAAYPNYFGDVGLFRATLERIIFGKSRPEFILPEQPSVRPKPRETPDLSWFFQGRRRWK